MRLMTHKQKHIPSRTVAARPAPLTWETARSRWIASLTGHEPYTRRSYRSVLTQLIHWANANQIRLEAFTLQDFDAYMQTRAHLKPTTQHHDRVVPRCFFAWCHSRGYLPVHPLEELELPGLDIPYIKVPQAHDLTALLTAIWDYWNPQLNPRVAFRGQATCERYALRDYAIIVGLMVTGLRIGEMLALRLSDVHENETPEGVRTLSLTIRKSKNHAPRDIPVTSPDWCECLTSWLARRIGQSDGEAPLFPTVTGRFMRVDTFDHRFKEYLEFAGFDTKEERYTPHGIRHRALTKTAEVSVLAAQHLAGHKSLLVTLRYLHKSEQFLRAQLQNVQLLQGVRLPHEG